MPAARLFAVAIYKMEETLPCKANQAIADVCMYKSRFMCKIKTQIHAAPNSNQSLLSKLSVKSPCVSSKSFLRELEPPLCLCPSRRVIVVFRSRFMRREEGPLRLRLWLWLVLVEFCLSVCTVLTSSGSCVCRCRVGELRLVVLERKL